MASPRVAPSEEERRRQQQQLTATVVLTSLLAAAHAAGATPGASTADRIVSAVRAFDAGRIPRPAFVELMRSELSAKYIGSMFEGATSVGGSGSLSLADLRVVQRLLDGQEPLIERYANQIEEGTWKMRHEHRAKMYEQSAQTARQFGRLMGYADVLGADAANARYRWVLDDDKENCEPCLKAAAGGPYLLAELPGMPGWPYCEGGVRCGCRIVLVGTG